MSQYLIYALLDPESKEVRYIGKSSSGLRRPAEHLCRSNYTRSNTHKNCWIRSVVAKGKLPEIKVLAELENDEDAYLCEIDMIAMHRLIGTRLTNCLPGGEGRPKGLPLSPEARQKMSAIRRGKKQSRETVAKRDWATKLGGVRGREVTGFKILATAVSNNQPTAVFDSTRQAQEYGFDSSRICKCLKSGKPHKGFYWTRQN